jgi:hypothetical protein
VTEPPTIGIPTPRDVLGFEPGDRPASHAELLAYFQALADAAPGAVFAEYGESHEGRRLARLTLGSAANLEREDAASAWVGCGLHGDEPTGGNAALAIAHRLAAGTDTVAELIRDRLVVHIDPAANPDGRERWLAQITAMSGAIASHDPADFVHLGMWPRGRGNHYLVDLNRDLIVQSQPETRARTRELTRLAPQLVLELHEMWSDEAFLFASPGAPLNPQLPPGVHGWWARLGEAHGAALDAAGVPWYRGEWNEVFYPGYQDIWPAYSGAVPVIFEQAAPGPVAVRRPGGTILTFGEAVSRQTLSAFANLEVAARESAQLVDGWAAIRDEASAWPGAYAIANRDPVLTERLRRTLCDQGIAVLRTADEATATDPHGARVSLPAGSLLIRRGQPLGRLVQVLLDAEIPLPEDFVEAARRRLEDGGESGLFDVTAWSLPLAFGLECIEVREDPDGAWADAGEPPPASAPPSPSGGHRLFHDPLGTLTGRLLAAGVLVRLGGEPFTRAGRAWAAGTMLVRADENDGAAIQLADQLARDARIELAVAEGARSDSGPDLGSRAFRLLDAPRIALVGGDGIDEAGYGSVWHLLDAGAGHPVSGIAAPRLADRDLLAYDVMVIPPTDPPATPPAIVPAAAAERLRDWVRGGGTLILLGNACELLAPGALELGSAALAADELDARFAPGGAFLRAEVRSRHWLAWGLDRSLPVMAAAPALIEPGCAEVVARFASAEDLRVAGLLWPEAARALAGAPYLLRERVGHGQLVAFASHPAWRGAFPATARLLVRAALASRSFRAS